MGSGVSLKRVPPNNDSAHPLMIAETALGVTPPPKFQGVYTIGRNRHPHKKYTGDRLPGTSDAWCQMCPEESTQSRGSDHRKEPGFDAITRTLFDASEQTPPKSAICPGIPFCGVSSPCPLALPRPPTSRAGRTQRSGPWKSFRPYRQAMSPQSSKSPRAGSAEPCDGLVSAVRDATGPRPALRDSTNQTPLLG